MLGHTRNAAFLTLFNTPSRILVGVPCHRRSVLQSAKKYAKNPLNAKFDDSPGAPMVSDERRFEFESAIRRDVPRDLLVEIEHQFGLAAQQAEAAVSGSQTAVTYGVALSRRRASRATGLVRFQIIDEMFEQMLNRHGAEFVKSVPIEQGPDEIKDAPVYLTTGRFGHTMIGFASHREVDDLPIKNATRSALCNQNRGLSYDLFHPPEMFTDRERFVVIMVRRDAHALGKIASITVCVADARSQSFLFQADIKDFLAGYGSQAQPAAKAFSLKQVKKSFKASKKDGSADDEKGNEN